MAVSEVIQDCVEGQQVPALTGVIKKVWKTKTGSSQHGAYTQQGIVLTDGLKDLSVTLWNRDDVPESDKGKTISIYCVKGDKGLTGILYKPYTDKQGVMVPSVSVTAQADVQGLVNGKPATAPSAPATNQRNVTPAPQNQSQPVDRDPVIVARQAVARAGNLWLIAAAGAELCRERFVAAHDRDLTPEQFQSLVATLFIHCQRQGVDAALPAEFAPIENPPLPNIEPEEEAMQEESEVPF